MSVRRHVDDLFTGAYDDDLSPIDEARFQAHLRSCPDCAAAYSEFTATVEALRELPKARMARVVHLPSTAPVAEASRRRISLGWLNAGLLRRFPATAVAGAVAVALVVFALVHGTGGSTATSSQGSTAAIAPAGQPADNHGGAAGGSAVDAACAQAVTPVAGSTPPANFSQPVVTQPQGQSGDQLDLAASTLSVAPGQALTLYAQFSEPLASAGAPGSTGNAPAAIRAVRPCLSVAVGSSPLLLLPGSYSPEYGGTGAVPDAQNAAGLPAASASGPLVTFTVPAGLAPGTVIHVQATIPAGFESAGSPALTAALTITTR
jgi:anti-sigma factor RsiW